MRLLLTTLVFLASLAAAVFVHAARADAAWERPQQIDAGNSPRVRLTADGVSIAYAKGDVYDPSELLVSTGNEPLTRVKVSRGGRIVDFDADAAGRLTAIRASEPRRGRVALLAWDRRRWVTVTRRVTSAPGSRLAVAGSGAAVLAWLQPDGHRVYVRAAVRPPGARRFGPSQRISGPTQRGGQTLKVAIDDQGGAAVVFSEDHDLWMWRPGSPAQRIHDATEVTASAFAATVAVRGQTAVAAFTRLEDREPPRYRLSAATRSGAEPASVETVATDVSATDVSAAVDPGGVPVVVGAPIGPPYSLRLHRREGAWTQATAIPATEAPSTIRYADGAVTWTEGPRGFAWFAGQKLSLGRASDPAATVAGGRAVVVWDRGPGRAMRLAAFTP